MTHLVLSTPVALHDIRDVNMFVRNALDKAPVRLEAEEFEELVAEGLVILYELAGKYEPHRPGYARAGSFAGYAAIYLPKRMTDAWHRSHPEHRYITLPDGKRAWQYLKQTVSLDEQRIKFANVSGRENCDEVHEGRFVQRSQWVPVPEAGPLAA